LRAGLCERLLFIFLSHVRLNSLNTAEFQTDQRPVLEPLTRLLNNAIGYS
jgi:hypothetical protein